MFSLREHPGKGELGGGHLLFPGELLDRFDDRQVVLEVVLVHAGVVAAEVALAEIGARPEAAGQKAPAEWRIGHEADPQLFTNSEDLLLQPTFPQREFRLERRDRMDRMGATNGLRGRLRETEVPDLAGFDELGHCSDRLFDRGVRVDPVLVVEVDVVQAEVGQ